MASQPIIRGIQAVGAISIDYRYNSADGILPVPEQFTLPDFSKDGQNIAGIETLGGISLSGFRLDSEFLRANPQIASSVVIPILGGGGVALTNNNRTGSLTLTCARVSTPSTDSGQAAGTINAPGSMFTDQNRGIGVTGTVPVYEAVFIAQLQQAQSGGGDSTGATITVRFQFNGIMNRIIFEGCTVSTVDPIGASGNDAVNYSVVWNYLNWKYETDKAGVSA